MKVIATLSVPMDAARPCKAMVNAKTHATTKIVQTISVTAWFTVPTTAQTTGSVTVSVISLVLTTIASRTEEIATLSVPKAAPQLCEAMEHVKTHATTKPVDLTGWTV